MSRCSSRDRGRFEDARKRLNESPLGAAALAGTSFPIDRDATAKALGFARPMRNSMDAISARDFALEYLAACTIASVHLSRLAGELVQWSTPAFGFVKLSDAFTTGSSIMPQKRNPDAAELIRGKTGRVLGDFVALATVVKGLVLTYGTDLQEDKERVFDAADTLELCLAAMAAMVADLTAQPDRMRAACEPGFPTATDLADWVVRVLKKPFREAHHIAGSIVKLAEDKGVTLDKLPLAEMQTVEPAITDEVFKVLSPEASVALAHEPGRHGAGAGEGTAALLAEPEMTFLIVARRDARIRIRFASPLLRLLAARFAVRCGVKNDLVKPNGQATHQGRARSVQAALPLGR